MSVLTSAAPPLNPALSPQRVYILMDMPGISLSPLGGRGQGEGG
jgi:hypothetical protein